MKRSKMIGATTVALLATSASLALAAGSQAVNEQGSGSTTTTVSGTVATIHLSGRVTGGPVKGSYSGTMTISNATGPGKFNAKCGSQAYPAKSVVFLAAGSVTSTDLLVLKETGLFCDHVTYGSFIGTYKVDGADSDGQFAGAGGAGTSTVQFGVSPTFTSFDTGNVILAKPRV